MFNKPTPEPSSLPKLALLAQNEGHLLVRSDTGFLLVFASGVGNDLAIQLATFDAEEWHSRILGTYQRELAGLNLELLKDASSLLSACPEESLATLNPAILAVCGGNLALYNWLHSVTPFRAQARLQALSVLPMLRWEFERMDDVTDRVRRRIDAGKSVWDAFLEIHPGRTAILRRIAASACGPEAWRGHLGKLLQLLDPLPPEKIPMDDAQWNAFHSIYLGLRLDGGERLWYLHENSDQRLEVKIRWLIECARLGWDNAYQRVAAFGQGVEALGDTFDFLDEIGRAGDWLDAQAHPERHLDWDNWCQQSQQRWQLAPTQWGLFRLLEASIRWHRQANVDPEADDSESKPKENSRTWPPLLPRPVSLTPTIQAIALASARDLASEGARMQHCVGGYRRACLLGESHIVSLRNGKGESLSTLEIRLNPLGTGHPSIIQHRSRNNRTPAPELVALENELLVAVRREANFKALDKWRKEATKLKSTWDKYEFNVGRLEMLVQALGRERLLSLFPGVQLA